MDDIEKNFIDLRQKITEIKVCVDAIDAELIAIGNLLIKKKIVSLPEIDYYTDIAIKQKAIEISKKNQEASTDLSSVNKKIKELLHD